MKRPILCGLILGLLASVACARDNIEITATKKTLDARKGNEQDLWRGTSRSVEKQICYSIELKNWSPATPTDVKVEWLILVEGAGGRLFPGTFGSKSISLALGQPVVVETEAFKLEGREWTGSLNPGTVEDDIAGYGIRVLSTDGTVLAEKYDPLSAKANVGWNLLDESSGEKARKLPPRLRPLKAP
ncbi:MAG TPA: hypothetical protein P5567_12085 [Kiritimatiellia bacterium]|nr:hypothetical protein [Kiritimatiellia bacterium]HRZ13181.1 hypothetical protein [Kiritimatiellia bacterium]HSA17602.1 hypothetical protein [Kiritimatiellia bacterium]